MVAITKVEAYGRFSWTGRTFYIDKLKFSVESNKHKYDYSCIIDPEYRFTCSVIVDDGKYEDIMIDPPEAITALNMVEAAINSIRSNVDISKGVVTLELKGKEEYTEIVLKPLRT